MKILYELRVRTCCFCFFLCLMWGNLNAQDPFLQNGNAEAEARAKELTEVYQPELVMDGEQLLLFENKLEEFLIREMRIKQLDVSPEDKLYTLKQLSEQQTAEMGNILTRPQLRRYMRIKQRIQPIAVVVDTVKGKE